MKPRLTPITADFTKPKMRSIKMNPTERDAKLAELRAILKAESVPQAVFPPDAGHSYFDATPAEIASRISSLTIAAQTVMTGDELCDKRLSESICIDLMETAAWLARKLAHYHDDLDRATWKPDS